MLSVPVLPLSPLPIFKGNIYHNVYILKKKTRQKNMNNGLNVYINANTHNKL